MATKGVYVGVSGFSYPSWRGKFYPKEAKSEEFLSLYSDRLGTVEINSSFYAPPSRAMVASWSGRTGEKFIFSFKAPKVITHIKKLGKDSVGSALRFSETIEVLGHRRGPVLFQLPPYAKQDLGLLGEFLAKTKDIKKRVFEFRHESWFQDSTYMLLERNGAGFCIVDSEDLTTVFKVTGGFGYFRLRKESYEVNVIDEWADKIRKATDGVAETYVYLRHDETGENAILAQRLSGRLGA
jgi:uncharacterized protein YecE (DUF72 family)